jgi:hypothetical protein
VSQVGARYGFGRPDDLEDETQYEAFSQNERNAHSQE